MGLPAFCSAGGLKINSANNPHSVIDPIIGWLVEFNLVFSIAIMLVFAFRYWYIKEEIIERLGDLIIVGTGTFSFLPSLLFIILAIKKDTSKMVDVFQEFSPYIAIYSVASLLLIASFLYSKWQKKPVKTGE